MTFSYSGNPQSSPRDAVRFMCGDTAEGSAFLQDGEVDYLLTQASGKTVAAAIAAMEAMIVRCAGFVDETVGNVSVQFSQRLTNLQKILTVLKSKQGSSGTAKPFAGGIYRADKAQNESNPALVRGRFVKGDRHQASPEGGCFGDNLKGGRWWR